jgi:hypothetical protein
MGGGLLQLIAVGQVDEFLTVNPELSFYQYVYKRHTNFAMESRSLIFLRKPILTPNSVANVAECTISRHGDLLGEVFFCFTLPNIYSSDKYRFQWVQNVGNHIIKNASVYIDGIKIDQTTGEWMSVWNELTSQSGDDKNDKMIGNSPDMQTPRLSKDRVTIKNNKFIYFYYPESSKDSNTPPSIPSKQIVVPLKFWFTKKPSLALPLLRLQFNEVTIRIEMESSEMLYQVFSPDLETYVSPSYYNELYGENITINTFAEDGFELNSYIEANYIFLGEDERNTLAMKSKLTYLVEQLNINMAQSVPKSATTTNIVNLLVNIPTKEIIWTLRRDDYYKYNNFMNYSADIPESNRGILDRAQLNFSRKSRFEEKSAEYFNMIQPYQYHSKIPKQGIYSYSFSLYPEKELLSGYYNAGCVTTELYLYVKNDYNNDIINNALVKMGKTPYDFDYLVNAYCVCYNIFEIIGNQVGMKCNI